MLMELRTWKLWGQPLPFLSIPCDLELGSYGLKSILKTTSVLVGAFTLETNLPFLDVPCALATLNHFLTYNC